VIKKVFIALVCAIGLMGSTGVDAEGEPEIFLEISPAGIRTNLAGGESKSFEVVVKNIGGERADVKMYAKPYNVNGDDYGLDLERENLHSQIFRWIEFEEAEFELGVGAEKAVKFTITVPENAVAGGQYAAIFAESSGEGLGDGASGIRMVVRTSSLLYARIGNDAVQDVGVELKVPMINVGRKIFGTGEIVNRGNVRVEAKYIFEIRPLFSDQILFSGHKERVVLPDSDGVGQVESFEWEETPWLGVFRAKYIVSVDGDEEVVTRIVFVMPIVVVVLVGILGVLTVVWVVMVVKMHRTRVGRRLVRKMRWRK
jgi:hypothetical protein